MTHEAWGLNSIGLKDMKWKTWHSLMLSLAGAHGPAPDCGPLGLYRIHASPWKMEYFPTKEERGFPLVFFFPVSPSHYFSPLFWG